MYLLKLYNAGATAVTGMNSHSTMYLLKHMPYNGLRLPHSNSHSTMYLLKLFTGSNIPNAL